MFRRLGSLIVIASALTLAATGALAAASPAQALTNQVGPHQFFVGEVFGKTAQSVIEVACPAAGTEGHPVPGQTVEVLQFLPPVTVTAGYTGDLAVEIDAALIFPPASLVGKVPVATFTEYSLMLPIPTSITVPASGSGTPTADPGSRAWGAPPSAERFQSRRLPSKPGARWRRPAAR